MSISPRQLLRAEISSLSAYSVADIQDCIKLDAMENPYDWPQELREKLQIPLLQASFNRYPDSRATELVQNFRKTFAVPHGIELMFGNGSDELIQILIMAIARADACILTVTPSFSMYELIAKFIGVRVIKVPLSADSFSLQTELVGEAIREHNPALIFLAYPNNPTGTLWPQQQVEQIVHQSGGLVVIDEAYFPFSACTMLPLIERHAHVLVLRTLSKMGFAGLRLGCLLGREIWVTEFNKLRLPYNINILTQISTNIALENIATFNKQTRMICEQRKRLMSAMRDISGIQVFPSHANFVLFRTLEVPAATVFNRLAERNIMIKNVADNDLLENCLRVTVGTEEESRAFLNALKDSLI